MITIEQSKVLTKRRAQNELNDRIVAMHTKKVASKEALIEEAKFFVLHSTPEDLNRPQFVQKLLVLNKELASALDDLTRCKMAMIESMGDKQGNDENTNNN